MRYNPAFSGANPSGDAAIFDASPYEAVLVCCGGLGAAESLAIERHCGTSGWIAASINEANTVVTLTLTGSGGSPASRNQVKVDGGGPLRVTGTAVAVTINYIPLTPLTP